MCDCASPKIMSVSGKVSDMCDVKIPHMAIDHEGYVPGGLGVGSGDYLRFSVCLICGKLQNFKPMTDEAIREVFEDE